MLPQFLIKIFVKKRNLGYYREKRTNLSGLRMAEKSKKDLEIDSLRDKARAYKELRAHQAGGSESGGSCSWSAVSRVDETVKIDGLDNFLSFKISLFIAKFLKKKKKAGIYTDFSQFCHLFAFHPSFKCRL